MANEIINNTIINTVREANEGILKSIKYGGDVKVAFNEFDKSIMAALASQGVKSSTDWVVGGDIDRAHVKNSCVANITNVLAESVQFGHGDTALSSEAFKHAVNLDVVGDVAKRISSNAMDAHKLKKDLMEKYDNIKNESQQTGMPKVAAEVQTAAGKHI